jgi:hypothetical protein
MGRNPRINSNQSEASSQEQDIVEAQHKHRNLNDGEIREAYGNVSELPD